MRSHPPTPGSCRSCVRAGYADDWQSCNEMVFTLSSVRPAQVPSPKFPSVYVVSTAANASLMDGSVLVATSGYLTPVLWLIQPNFSRAPVAEQDIASTNTGANPVTFAWVSFGLASALVVKPGRRKTSRKRTRSARVRNLWMDSNDVSIVGCTSVRSAARPA